MREMRKRNEKKKLKKRKSTSPIIYLSLFLYIYILQTYETDEKVTDDDVGPIEPDNQNVRKEPYALPADFEWVSLDINTESQVSFFLI